MSDWVPSTPWGSLADRLVVVTGAAGGIGRATVARMLEVGSHVIASDLDDAALGDLASELGSPRLQTMVVDVGSPESIARLELSALESPVPLAAWINNAGIGLRTPASEVTLSDWTRVLDVNLRSVMLGSQSAHRVLVAQGSGGSIVNLSSVAGVHALPGRSVYGTTKAAVTHLTRQLAREWGADGIRVNAIAPGFILTPISHLASAPEHERRAAIDAIPLGRLGAVDDIARTVLWLSSDASSYQTGQLMIVDGGLTLD